MSGHNAAPGSTHHTPEPERDRRSRWDGRGALLLTVALIVATTAQLAVATFATGLPQFEGKAFGSRLIFYPAMMILPIVIWWAVVRRRSGRGLGHPGRQSLPWAGFALVCAPFFVDVTGNSFDLYDSITWWDDANHFVNWALLCGGIGLMLTRARDLAPWVLALLVTGIGAVLAIGWEVAEWYTFIRHGTELADAYTDTLSDQTLGTLGAAAAGAVLGWGKWSHGRTATRRTTRSG